MEGREEGERRRRGRGRGRGRGREKKGRKKGRKKESPLGIVRTWLKPKQRERNRGDREVQSQSE